MDFQPASAPTFAGYVADTGAVYGPHSGYSYGWLTNNVNATIDNNSKLSPDQRYDTLIQMQRRTNPNATWEVAVPNGSYSVRVVAGDARSHNSVYRIAAEGVTVLDFTPSASARFGDATKTVTVTDGRLTITNGIGAENNKLCFIDIARVG